MCGIIGIVSEKPIDPVVFKRLLVGAMGRGRAATGMMFYSATKKEWEYVKGNVDAIEFSRDERIEQLFREHQPRIAVGHTRTPTCGSPLNNNNNHPLIGNKFILMHNGRVDGGEFLEGDTGLEDEGLEKWYEHYKEKDKGKQFQGYEYNGSCDSELIGTTEDPRIQGYKYNGSCDSELILSYLEILGIKKGLHKTDEYSFAAIAFAKLKSERLFLWRNCQPLEMGLREEDGEKTIYFGSTVPIIEDAISERVWFSFYKNVELAWSKVNEYILYEICFDEEGKIVIEASETMQADDKIEEVD